MKEVKENWASRLSNLLPQPSDSNNGGPAPRDVRILDVLVDPSGDFYRDIPSRAAASFEEEMNDWPFGAIRNGNYILLYEN